MNEQEAIVFMAQYKLCVLATVDTKGKSESAVVGFSVHEGCRIVVATSSKSRKFHNIAQNPTVSAVVGWDEGKTIQYEGQARVLEGDELAVWLPKHFARQPESAKYKDNPHERYILVEPAWLRLTDCTQHPWGMYELVFEPTTGPSA